MKEEVKEKNKTANSTYKYERKYSDEFFDSLYTNFNIEKQLSISKFEEKEKEDKLEY